MSSEKLDDNEFHRPPSLIRLLPSDATSHQIVPTGSRPVYYFEWVPVAGDDEYEPTDIVSSVQTLQAGDPPELYIDGEQRPIIGEIDRTEDGRHMVNYVRLGEPRPPGTYDYTFRVTVDESLRLRRCDGFEDIWSGRYEYSGSFSVRQVASDESLPTIEKKITTSKRFVDPDWHRLR